MTKNSIKDTSTEYEDMVGYVAEDNLNKSSLSEFMGEQKEEYKPSVRMKVKDPEFPEDWQRLIVNFNCFEDYSEFMNKMGSKPVSKLKSIIYENPETKLDILSFMGGDDE